jgi:hypothetical protein
MSFFRYTFRLFKNQDKKLRLREKIILPQIDRFSGFFFRTCKEVKHNAAIRKMFEEEKVKNKNYF